MMLLTCYDCAQPVDTENLLCPFCGSSTLTHGVARPSVPRGAIQRGDPFPLPAPWLAVLGDMGTGAVVGLYGGPGAGKSAIAAQLPDLVAWFTTEQTVGQARDSLDWATGGRIEHPEIFAIHNPDQLRAHLDEILTSGVIVLDSLTRAGTYYEQVRVLEDIEAWSRGGVDRRAVVILQINERGEPAGLKESEHLTTAIVALNVEPGGLRRASATKNREGPLGSAYYILTEKGVERPRMAYSYSVEGTASRLRLHPFPLPGAKWAGLLAVHFKDRPLSGGYASAAISAPGYPGDVLEPFDVMQRRRFAESAGLTWLNPTDIEE